MRNSHNITPVSYTHLDVYKRQRVSVASGKANSEESMSKLDLNALNELPKVDRILALAETNAELEKLDAEGDVYKRQG